MNTKLFGTDGIRARAGEFPLNSDTVAAIGCAIGEKLGGDILVGQDTRLSSPWIHEHLIRGIGRTNAKVENAGVIPTPAVALLVKNASYSGGIMISASHNPYEDNGIKVFSATGTKLNDTDETAIETRVHELIDGRNTDRVDDIPAVDSAFGINELLTGRYQELLLSHFDSGRWLEGIRIVVDCANGAMSHVAPAVLRQLGAEVIVTNNTPTGTNINKGCGAVHLESLKDSMQNNPADLGVAFDGDGDRSLFISASGRLIDGDAVLLSLARRLKRERRLNPPVVVGTLMTNFSLEKLLQAEGIDLKRVGVGDRYIFEEMQSSGAVLGGEPSGHIIFSDFRLSGDGLLTTLKLAELMSSDRVSLDELTADWIQSPQLLKNVRVRQRVALETLPRVTEKLMAASRELERCGRLVVRYSGTEPLLRVMIESDDADRNERLMSGILETIREELGSGA